MNSQPNRGETGQIIRKGGNQGWGPKHGNFKGKIATQKKKKNPQNITRSKHRKIKP